MRALVYGRYGTPDELHVEEVGEPPLGPGDVRVRIVASSINDWDRDLLRGEPLNRAIAPLRPKHRILGADAAGVVDAVGAGVVGLEPGDEVVADLSPHGFGAFAEYAVAPASAWSVVPAGLTLEQAAALPQAGGLAVTGLRSAQPLAAGQRIAISGAGGGVGTFAVQIAKAAGAHVTAVDAAHKLDALVALGADRVVDYTRDDFTRAASAYDAIVEISAHHGARDYRLGSRTRRGLLDPGRAEAADALGADDRRGPERRRRPPGAHAPVEGERPAGRRLPPPAPRDRSRAPRHRFRRRPRRRPSGTAADDRAGARRQSRRPHLTPVPRVSGRARGAWRARS